MARYSIVKRQRKYYKDGVEVPAESITDFGSYKYFKNIVTTKYWKEITTGGRELEYACYGDKKNWFVYAKAPLGSDLKTYYKMASDGIVTVPVTNSSELKHYGYMFSSIDEDSSNSSYFKTQPRTSEYDLYIDTTKTETVEGTPEDYTYTTEEITPVEVTAEDEYDFTEFVPSTQFDYYEDKNSFYNITKRHRAYYKYGTEPNATVVGSFGRIDKGVASGFTTANYLVLPENFNVSDGSNWEVVFKFTAKNVSTYQFFNGVDFNGFALSINGIDGTITHKLGFFLSHTAGSWDIGYYAGITTLVEGNTYWIKALFNGFEYQVLLADNADFNNATTEITVGSTTPVSPLTNMYVGGLCNANLPLQSSIDLSQSYIKINNELWWSGDSYTKVGSWIDDGVVSGFTTGNYLQAPEDFAPGNSTWEAVFKFTAKNVSTYQYFQGRDSTSWGLAINGYQNINRKLFLVNWTANTSAYGITEIIEGQTYFVKVRYDLSKYEVLLADNAEFNNATTEITLNTATPVVTITKMPIGMLVGAPIDVSFRGSIDLTQSYIKINNKDWWRGTKVVESTEADADYYTERNVPYNFVYNPYEVISETFNVSSELQTYIVPEGVDKLNVVCVASRGATGSAAGGAGGSVKCDLSVTPNQTLYITVGGIPSSAGSPFYNASDIRIDGTELANRIIVAGGGGSGAWRRGSGVGGKGGGLVGENGASSGYTGGGGGGTQTSGGAGGTVQSVGSQWSSYGGSGSLGIGGTSDNHSNHYAIGGVGGAGYYGGGGGGGIHTDNFNQAAGGGGGSSYTDDTLCTNVIHLQGNNNDEGFVKISYIKGIYK